MTLITESSPKDLSQFYADWMGEKVPALGFLGEQIIYAQADRMSRNYTGGMWDFRQLSNGGFYTFPKVDRIIGRHPMTGDVELSGQAFGLAVSIITVNHLNLENKLSHHPYCRLMSFLSQEDGQENLLFPDGLKVFRLID